MAQKTETYQIPFERGGFNANPNIDLIPAIAMVSGSRNFNMHNGGREKRGGNTKQYTLPATPQVMGLHDFRLESGTQFKIACTKDGKVYKNFSTTIKTGMSLVNRYWLMTLRNTLYICDKATRPQTWDGAAAGTSDITSIPTDWSGSNFPQVMFTHSNGASFRNIAVGTPGFLDTVYCSASDNGQDFSDANVVRVVIPTNDAYGIITGAEFGSRALLFGKRKAYILNDLDFDVASWGYQAAQWEGGVASPWLLVKTPNDLIAMMDDGEIYSVLAVQQYGDYAAASISRPSFIHTWIKNNVDLSRVAEFSAVYDPLLRAIKFFVALNSKTYVDTVLMYYVDRDPKEAWSYHDNPNNNSGYRASAATVLKVAEGNYKVYTGGYLGEVWSLEEAVTGDDGAGYTFAVKTPPLNFDQPRMKKLYIGGRLTMVAQGDVEITVHWWVDGLLQDDRLISTVTLSGVYGTSYFGSAVYAETELIDPVFELGQIGKRIELQFENAIPGDYLFISACYLDFKWIGKTPE